jgi:PAS domain-containing protein
MVVWHFGKFVRQAGGGRRGQCGAAPRDDTIVLHNARLRRARDALRESEARLAKKPLRLDATLQNMDQGIIKMDAHRVVEVVNHRRAEFFDLPESVATRRRILSPRCLNGMRQSALTEDPVEQCERSRVDTQAMQRSSDQWL